MNLSALFAKHRDNIRSEMTTAYAMILESDCCDNDMRIYLWDDGYTEIITADETPLETPEMHYVTTVSVKSVQLFDSMDTIPEDDHERLSKRNEAIESLVSQYESSVDDEIDHLILRMEIFEDAQRRIEDSENSLDNVIFF